MELLQQILCFSIWLVVFPMMIGVIPSLVVERKHKTIGTIYLSGWLSMAAIFQLLAVPFIMQKKSLTELNFTFSAVIEILAVSGLLFYLVGIIHDGIDEFMILPKKPKMDIYWILFLVILGFQLVMSVVLMTPDGDDAYYITHAVIADREDSMFLRNAYTGGYGILEARHVLAPFSMFYAILARKSGISATIVAHTIMPLVLIPITYLIYYKIAELLFEKEKEKLPIFMILIAGIQLFGNTSLYTNETFFLTRTWQGKSILANIAMPAVVYILLVISKQTEHEHVDHYSRVIGWFVILLMTNLMGALASSLGVLFLAIMEGVLSFLVTIRNKKIWILLAAIITMAPNFVYMWLYKSM